MIEQIITTAINKKASDIHLSEGEVPYLRIDGKMVALDGFGKIDKNEIGDFRFDALCSYKVHNQYQADCAIERNGYKLRLHFYSQRGKLSVAMRIGTPQIPSIDELNLPQGLKRFTKYKNGIVLLTGTAGSGKSTTLASMIEYINETDEKHIITIEDPVEFEHINKKSVIHKREIGMDVGSFKEAISAAVREDPDIVLIGEIRDYESILNAIEVADTGHLVFTTMHTGNTAESINRIIDVFPADQQKQVRSSLANLLRVVIGQILIPCNSCGRIPLCEIMVINDAIRSAIMDSGNEASINSQIYSNYKTLGSQTYYQSAAFLMQNNLVSGEEVLKVLKDEKKLEDTIKFFKLTSDDYGYFKYNEPFDKSL